MEFHGDWTLLDMEDFETASSPRDPGALGVDVLVSKAARLPTELRCTGLSEWDQTRRWNSPYSACPPPLPTWPENLPYRGKFTLVKNLCDRGT